jgi:flagellar protein FlaJ
LNIYGYDLVTALNNVSKNTPSERLAELLNGLSTTIHSGGGLPEFFNQRSETLLATYRLDREKYTKTAETFMDIYISLVIATPIILILLLVMIGVSGIQIGFSPTQMSLMIILIIALVNISFLGVLHVKQPKY